MSILWGPSFFFTENTFMANVYLVVCFSTIYVNEQAEEEGDENFNVVHILYSRFIIQYLIQKFSNQ
jgi:hypothetical protein